MKILKVWDDSASLHKVPNSCVSSESSVIKFTVEFVKPDIISKSAVSNLN